MVVKEIVVEKLPHETVIGADRGPPRRPYRVEPGTHDRGSLVRLQVGGELLFGGRAGRRIGSVSTTGILCFTGERAKQLAPRRRLWALLSGSV